MLKSFLLFAVILAVAVASGVFLFQEGAKKGARSLYETIYSAGQGVVADEAGNRPIGCFRMSGNVYEIFVPQQGPGT